MHIYNKLNVNTIINAAGTYTELGGTLMPDEVKEAMLEAAEKYVNIYELQQQAGKYIAKLLDIEAAFITSGATAGILLSTAACLAGSDPARIAKLPDTIDMRNEVIIHRSHYNNYLQSVRAAGAKLVEIGSPLRGTPIWELEDAIREKTAAVLYFVAYERSGDIPLQDFINVAHKSDIPVIVDAAAELPPVRNFKAFNDLGADLVLFSGGKALRGPQNSGLILGKSNLINSCMLQSSPNERLGRPLKVSKEVIAGLVVAVERFLKLDHSKEIEKCNIILDYIKGKLTSEDTIDMSRVYKNHNATLIPRLNIKFDLKTLGVTRQEIIDRLIAGNPPIYFGELKNSLDTLTINPFVLIPGDEKIIVNRLKDVLGHIKNAE